MNNNLQNQVLFFLHPRLKPIIVPYKLGLSAVKYLVILLFIVFVFKYYILKCITKSHISFIISIRIPDEFCIL